MKKRRTSIAAFLLLASLGLGVGYSNISRTFRVNGEVLPGTSHQVDVAYTGVVTEVGGTTFMSAGYTASGNNASFSLTKMDTVGQTAVIELEVRNNTSKDLGIYAQLGTPQLDSLTTSGSYTPADYFEITMSWKDSANTNLAPGGATEANSTNSIVVSVKLIKAVLTTFDAADFIVSFQVEANYPTA